MYTMGYGSHCKHSYCIRQLSTPMLLCAMCQESHKQMSATTFSFLLYFFVLALCVFRMNEERDKKSLACVCKMNRRVEHRDRGKQTK